MWSFIVALSVLLLYISAILCAVRAAQTARTPQGAVGWVVFLLSVPWAGVPLYLFLGHHRFTGYRVARRESERVVQGIKAYSEHMRPAPEDLTMNVKPFEAIANLPVLKGNEAELLVDGEATFDAIFDALDSAQDYILIQFYIVRADDLGLRLQAKLIEAAARGVTVRFMTDAVGSYHLPNSYYEEMRNAGVEVVMPSDQRGPKYRFQLNYRNHRKTVVIDGTTGFIGGHNVGDEYLGLDPNFGRWRDTHLRIRGPIVSQLQLIFVEDWHWARDEDLLDALNWTAPDVKENANAVIVATGPGDTTETGSMMFFSAIAAAQDRIWLASPYFVPDIDVMTALTNAAMRGVDVRLLVPDVIDHKMPWLAAFAYFDEIMEAGVKVYRYTDGFMHQKAFVVDHALAAVGTTNLDNRSFRLNFEAMALFFDADIAAAVDEMFQEDFENAYELVKPLALQPAFVRYGAPLARLVSPIL